MLAGAFALYAGPLGDIDVWWHLAAGRWIVEHARLPDADPFGVFGAGNPVRMATVLKGQWLGQVALYAAMEAAGPLGVALARAAALAAAAALVFVRTRRLGGSPATSVAATAVSAAALLGFPGERPQVFAFVLAGVVLLLAEEWERGRAWALPALAAAGVLWANVHGSVLIAVGVLAVMAGAEGLRVLLGARNTSARGAGAAAAVLAAATLASPNGLTTYRYVLETQGGELARRTTEYVGALRVHAADGWAPEALVVGFFTLAAAAAWPLARSAPRRAAAALALAAASVTSYRYHAFFVLVACPWLAIAAFERAGSGARRATVVAGLVAAALACAVSVAWGGPLAALREPVTASRLPIEAVARLRSAGMSGRALVWLDWSGYVLWREWPRITPFVDARMLDDAALAPYTHVIWATPEGLAFLDAANLSSVLLPFRSPTGDVYALHAVLRARSDWMIEYGWPGGALYRRREGIGSRSLR